VVTVEEATYEEVTVVVVGLLKVLPVVLSRSAPSVVEIMTTSRVLGLESNLVRTKKVICQNDG
jgi:hypothetical protein